jgi:hypothetical protein
LKAGMKHTAIITEGERPRDARFKWTNTGLANVKGAITGTCRSCDPQPTEHYLAAYEWRFNRRFELDRNVERLARVAARTAPMRFISSSEAELV